MAKKNYDIEVVRHYNGTEEFKNIVKKLVNRVIISDKMATTKQESGR